MAQVAAYHSEWREYFVPLIFQKAQLGGYSELPSFHYTEETMGGVAMRVSIVLIGLTIIAAPLGVAGFRQLRRYPVTA